MTNALMAVRSVLTFALVLNSERGPVRPAASPAPPIQGTEFRYMADCSDGDGHLTGWVNTFDEAARAGQAHEFATKGHHWVVVSQPLAQKVTMIGATVAAAVEQMERATVTWVGGASVPRGKAIPATAIGSTGAAAQTGVCRGPVCSTTSVDWTGGGYQINNRASVPIRVSIRWSSGAECLGSVAYVLAPGRAVEVGNGAYCNPYEALPTGPLQPRN